MFNASMHVPWFQGRKSINVMRSPFPIWFGPSLLSSFSRDLWSSPSQVHHLDLWTVLLRRSCLEKNFCFFSRSFWFRWNSTQWWAFCWCDRGISRYRTYKYHLISESKLQIERVLWCPSHQFHRAFDVSGWQTAFGLLLAYCSLIVHSVMPSHKCASARWRTLYLRSSSHKAKVVVKSTYAKN